MRNEKFTKGVWSIADCREIPDADYDYSIVDENGWNIARVENCSIEEEEANAHLIAAAPDMYALLSMMVSPTIMMSQTMRNDNLRTAIETVLKKARGTNE